MVKQIRQRFKPRGKLIANQDKPLSVIRTKFKGDKDHTFFWAAFFSRPQDIVMGFGDLEGAEINFWKKHDFKSVAIGTGKTPGSAIQDLYARQNRLDNQKENTNVSYKKAKKTK